VTGKAVVDGKADMVLVGPIGSRHTYTTFFIDGDNIGVCCGCFYGSIDEFDKKVDQTHTGNHFHNQYKAAIDMAKKILIIKPNETI
jgi:hypothetical protein